MAGGRGRDHEERAGRLQPEVERVYVGCDLLVADERLVEPRRLTAGEHVAEHVDLRLVLLEVGGRRIDHVDARRRDAVAHRDALLEVERGGEDVGPLERRARRNRSEVLLDERSRLRGVEVADDRERRVVRRVVGSEELLHVVERCGREVLHRPDDGVRVGVAVGEQVLEDDRERPAVRLVLALPLLVLYDVALIVELLDRQRVEQERHTIGLEPQGVLERLARNGLEVVRAVVVRRSVDAPRAEVRASALGERQVLALHVLRALEHHVLEEVGKAGAAGLLVLRADVVPQVDVYGGQLVIFMEDDLEAVRERVLLELQLGHALLRECLGSHGGKGCRGDGDRTHEGGHSSNRFHDVDSFDLVF